MEKLTPGEVLEILKDKPRNKSVKDEKYRCHIHDRQASFHTCPTSTLSDIEYLRPFLNWVNKLIDKSKYDIFQHLLTLPIETVDFTEGVFDEFKKIFGAQDRYIKHTFKNPDLEQDFEGYLEDYNDAMFWKQDAFEAMKSAISSILIVDLPEQQITNRPEPYQYLLDVQCVVDYKANLKGEFDWIVFKDEGDKNTAYYFDSTEYRKYRKTENEDWRQIGASSHNLGWTPAKSFWGKPMRKNAVLQKQGPISNSLSRLDWLLVNYVFDKHETLHVGFPIETMFAQSCSYKDQNTHVACSGGYIIETNENWEEIGRKVCPECGGSGTNKTMGPGTIIAVPPMADNKDANMIEAVKRIGAEVESLTWIDQKIHTFEQDIKWNITGFMQEQGNEAMNELQVSGNYETRENVLKDVRDNFQAIHQWSLNTRGYLRYGESYGGTAVNYGDKMFLMTTANIQESLKAGRENGMPIFEIVSEQRQLALTKYQNNPELIERIEILSHLEPYQGYSNAEVMGMKDFLDPELMMLKMNFPYYVHRFEREHNSDIGKFMQYVDIRGKIEYINQKLLEYVKEQKQNQQRAVEANSSATRGGGDTGNGSGEQGEES